MKGLWTIVITCIFVHAVYAQDTVKAESSVFYSGTDLHDSRLFYGSAKYAREDIVYTDSLRDIQYCYYVDSVRHCVGSTYQLKSPDILVVSNHADTIAWTYKKRHDSLYEINAFVDGFYSYGFASSLQPLKFTGNLTTTSADKADTLWNARCIYSEHSPEGYFEYTLHNSTIAGKIYNSRQCHAPPRLPNGTPFTELTWHIKEVCYNDPYYVVRLTAFVVTKEGRVKNISRVGNLEWGCSPVYIDFIKTVYRNSPVLPATRKGKPIHIMWEVKVNMEY